MHDPITAARIAREQAANPALVVEGTPEEETDEEAEARQEEYEKRRKEYEAEEEHIAAERNAAFQLQREEYEAEVKRREEQRESRFATLEHIIEQAPASFNAAQLRLFVELLLNLSSYGLFEEVAVYFVGDDENNNKSDDEILSEALAACADDKLMGFVLRLVLTEHLEIPRGEQTEWLTKAEALFASVESKKEKTGKKQKVASRKAKARKASARKNAA